MVLYLPYADFLFFFVDLEADATKIIAKSVSPGTFKTYKQYERRYHQFCRLMKLPTHGSGCEESMILWITSLHKAKFSYGTILSHVAAVKHMFHRKGYPVVFQSERLRLLLKGLRPSDRTQKCKKVPVTRSHLKRLNQAATILDSSTALRFRSMIALAFYGFLRPSEYCVTNRNHHIRVQDVKFARSKRKCWIYFRSFKHSSSPASIRLEDRVSEPLQPVALLCQYMEDIGHYRQDDPLFPVNGKEFSMVLKRVCHVARIKSRLTPHCFRHGGATWASKHGWSQTAIKAHGRWRSDAYNSYISPY